MAHDLSTDPPARAGFRDGFLAMLPLWTGAIPAGIAYGVAARSIGLGAIETQLMSLVVFSAAGQAGALSVLQDGAPAWLVIGTVLALNAQLPLLGVAVGRTLRLSWPSRLGAAALLTDGAYGIAAGRERLRLPTLLGAGAAMFLAWNAGTALGIVAGEILPDLRRLGLDFVIPLTFLAVLAPMVRARAAALAALAAAVTALGLGQVAPVGIAVLGSGLAGASAGAWASRNHESTLGSDHPGSSPP